MGPSGNSITISQSGGQLSSEKRASCRVNCTLWRQSRQEPNGREAAGVLVANGLSDFSENLLHRYRGPPPP